MKRVSLIILGIVWALGYFHVSAYNLYYYYHDDSYTATVSRTQPNNLPNEVEIPQTVIYNGQEYTVTEVECFWSKNVNVTKVTLPLTVRKISGYGYYYGDIKENNLGSINFPESLCEIGNNSFAKSKLKEVIISSTSNIDIGQQAFCDCTQLTSVSINSVGACALSWGTFQNCTALTTVVLSGGLKTLNDKTFYGCSSLENVTLPSNLQTIGASVFQGCSSLKSLSLPSSLKKINKNAFKNCASLMSLSLPGGVTQINESTFQGCASLTALGDMGNITTVGEYAFSGCKNLSFESMTNPLQEIDNYAFNGCVELTVVNLANSLLSIGDYAFNGCTNLVEIEADALCNLRNIGAYAFSGCKNLTVIETDVLSNLQCIGAYAFNECSALASFYFSNALTSMGNNAFNGCTGLTSISTSMETIGSHAFSGCENIAEVELLEGVVTIGEEAFADLPKLVSISFPSTVENIGKKAFYNCPLLENIEISPEQNLRHVHFMAFNGTKWYNEVIAEGGTEKCYYLGPICLGLIGKEDKGPYEYTDPYDGITGIAYKRYSVFFEDFTIKEGTTCIADEAFYCIYLRDNENGLPNAKPFHLSLPSSLRSIGDYAFSQIGAGVDSVRFEAGTPLYIGKRAFEQAYVVDVQPLLTPGSIIDDYAFHVNTGLKQVVAKDVNLGVGVFSTCGEFEYVEFDGMVEIPEQTCANCYSIRTINLGPSVKVVKPGAFSYWYANYGYYSSYDNNLESLELSEGLQEIYEYAFANVSHVAELVLPSTLRKIGLRSLPLAGTNDLYANIPAEVISNDNAQSNKSVFNLETYAAGSSNSDNEKFSRITLHVPYGATGAYKNHVWFGKFQNIVEMEPLAGDVNLDGHVDGIDLNTIINCVLGRETNAYADINGDGDFNGEDINMLINTLLGK